MKMLFVAGAGLLVAAFAAADDMPVPKMFQGAVKENGRWRMDLLEMSRQGENSKPDKSMSITLCMDSVMDMARDRRKQAEESGCTPKIVKDTTSIAVLEAQCQNSTFRSTITRESAKSYLIEGVGADNAGKTFSMKARYTYVGPCKQGASQNEAR